MGWCCLELQKCCQKLTAAQRRLGKRPGDALQLSEVAAFSLAPCRPGKQHSQVNCMYPSFRFLHTLSSSWHVVNSAASKNFDHMGRAQLWSLPHPQTRFSRPVCSACQ